VKLGDDVKGRLEAVRNKYEFERLLTPSDVAWVLKVSKRYVIRLWEFGKLRGVKVGRFVRFEAEEVKRFIENNRE
jgi:excisionase family DNA binding protein